MECELYEAATKGNVRSLLELLGKDKFLLDRIIIGNCKETPLHIVAMLGHLDFVEEILTWKAEMAREQDYQSSTPLHGSKRVPSRSGKLAMKGCVDVLECLVRVRPDAACCVIEHDQTIMHLCMMHNRLEALKLLMDILGDDQFINLRDEDGNIILHLAAADKQIETIIFLTSKGVDLNITNTKGSTTLGLLAQGQSVERASKNMHYVLENIHYVPQTSENHDLSRQTNANNKGTKERKREAKRKWQNGMHKALMVVAALNATLAYEAGKDPPGKSKDVNFDFFYEWFIPCNTISFIASLSTIMLLISGLPLKQRRITTWIAMLTMWVAINFTAQSHAFVIVLSSPDADKDYVNWIAAIAVLIWQGLMSLIFLCHIIRFILKLIRKVMKFVRKSFKKGKRENPMV
ncbi:hypothetical protein BT93_B2760 [Corymbia citriodora subsp. variegata]|nr:hypothetical protein BT93_B2760 [Corymbia citriodora subsp. variegata]